MIGSSLGAYEIVAPIGAGGMGEVYRARDTRLDRAVAIKILPESFAHDPDRMARFEREAKTLAALNHPNIAIVYGLEHSNGLTALVMEVVEGEDLAQRIARGAIPLDEALPIARQIAEAVEAAHEQGIVHRDLKPANVRVRDDGTVKVLDFGLAKALEPAGAASNVSHSPTITTPAMTQAGMILGTAAYMAPEQAKGKPADKRSDVWAFGCVLYEMLTGTRPFAGDDVSDTLAAVLRSEPNWHLLPTETPGPVRTLLRRCLTKDRKQRLSSAADARLEIDDALLPREPAVPSGAALTPRRPLWRSAVPAAGVIIIGLASGYAAWTLKPEAPRAVTRLEIPLGESDIVTASSALALSPDGTQLAYVVNNRLYLRALDRLDAAPIAGGEGPQAASPRNPFFSPDSQWVGFWEAGQIKKVSITGGAPVALCDSLAGTPAGATWAADNTILVGYGVQGIWRVSGDGGTLEQIITVGAGERAYGPQLLPDGRTVLFTLAPTTGIWDDAQIVVQSVDGGTRRTLVSGGTDGRYLPTGHLVYVHRQAVLAVPFDTTSLDIRHVPVRLLEGVRRDGGARGNAAQFTTSSNGTLAYLPPGGVEAPPRTLVWVDREGREEAIPAEPRPYDQPRLAPDATRLALVIEGDNQNRDIWVWDFRRGTLERVTSDPGPDLHPIWTADGQRLIFSSLRTGTRHLFRQAANGSGTAEQVVDGGAQVIVPYSLSPDGRYLVVRTARQGNSDLAIADLGGSSSSQGPSPASGEAKSASSSSVTTPKRLVETSSEEINAAISPDGRWLAYQSNASGTFEVYVRPFPDVEGGQWLVSTAGGIEPMWSRDMRELFYRSPKGAVMRVPIVPGATWTAGTATQLVPARSYHIDASAGTGPAVSRSYWCVSRRPAIPDAQELRSAGSAHHGSPYYRRAELA